MQQPWAATLRAMSTDWNICCLDCQATLVFNDANRMDMTMAVLCKHAEAIADLAPLFAADPSGVIELRLGHHYGDIDPGWFAAHRGHRLVPISEYGHFMDQCPEYVKCGCGSHQRCTGTPGHPGDHTSAPRQ